MVEGRTCESLTVQDTVSSMVIAYDDILDAKATIDGLNYFADTIAMNPKQLAKLLKSTAFRDASQKGDNQAIKRGTISMIGGLKVVVSGLVPDGTAIVLDSTEAGVLAYKRNFRVESENKPNEDSVLITGTAKFRAAVKASEAIVVIVGGSSKDYRA